MLIDHEFKSNAPSCVSRIWLDDNPTDKPGLWLKAKDGDAVLVPAQHIPALREIAVRAEKLSRK